MLLIFNKRKRKYVLGVGPMSKGEIPIGYIIALILGVAVVAILGYWFFVVQNKGGGEITFDQCRNKAYTYCTIWRGTGYAQDNGAPDLGLLYGGAKWFSIPTTGTTGVDAYAPECVTFQVLQTHTIGAINPTTGDAPAGSLVAECEELLSV
jgi:hypothetical protein